IAISIASLSDITALVALLDSAYRGENSKKGWTTEADLLEGEHRIDAAELQKAMVRPGAGMLKFVQDDKIVGCVYLHKQDRGLYLGMFSVSPELQAAGIGKKLL